MILIDSVVYIWLAFLLLVLPIDWLLSVLSAVIFHELCHIVVLMLFGGFVRVFSVSVTGCKIESVVPGEWQAFCSILAGPLGSISLYMWLGLLPKLAVCGLIHGLYNLMPVLPLDGGRALQLLLYRCCPQEAERILLWTGRVLCTVILIYSLYLSIFHYLGLFPFVLSLFWIIRFLPRKIPCKQLEIGVQ